MSLVLRKQVFGVSDLSDTNRAAQPQKIARGLKFRIYKVEKLVCVAKKKALISFAVTAKLVCVLVFAYAKSRISHDTAHIILHDIVAYSLIKQWSASIIIRRTI